MTGKVIFSFSVIIVLVFAVLGFAGLWPKQAKLSTTVKYGDVLENAPSPVAGLELFVPLVKDHFAGHIPEGFQLAIHLDDPIAKQWNLVDAYVYPIQSSGDVDLELDQRGKVIDQRDGSFLISFHGLPESTRYRVRLILIAQKNVITDIAPNKKKEWLSEYKKRAQETVDTILTQGGVSVSLKP